MTPLPPAFARLPLRFDAAALLAEVDALGTTPFVAHFNTGYHDGGWTGAALRTQGGDASRLYFDTSDESAPRDTPLLAGCPAIAEALERFECPLRAVRLLRLEAGSVIREHRDQDLLWKDGEARLHLPLATNPGVEFYVDNRRVAMAAGELWYLDLSRPHRVSNRGSSARIHLVIDCGVNEWLAAQVAAGAADAPAAVGEGMTGQEAFERFRLRVLGDEALQATLRAESDASRFAQLCVEIGGAHGLAFGPEDVRAAMNEGRRSWVRQWVL